MSYLIACGVGLGAVGIALWVMSSGTGLHRRFLYHFYERLGPDLYQATDDWQVLIELVSAHQFQYPAHLLDIGTATGAWPLALAQSGKFTGKITGLDWSPRMVELAQAQAAQASHAAEVNFQVVDVTQGLPFADESLDFITALGLLETMAAPEQVLIEMARVLKADGVLIISSYRGWSAWSVEKVQDFYQAQLQGLGFAHISRHPFKASHDLLLATRSPLLSKKDTYR